MSKKIILSLIILVPFFLSSCGYKRLYESDEKKIHFLKNKWTLWFHNPESDEWSEESYTKIYSFNTIEQFWALFNKIPTLQTLAMSV